MYEERFYRSWVKSENLVKFEVIVEETDLLISADKDLSQQAKTLVEKYRKDIKDYIALHPDFLTSLVPVKIDEKASDIVKEMELAAQKANVGPMAAVAGAVAEYVGRELLKDSRQVIIENGGDIFMKMDKEVRMGIYAGNSPLSGKIFIKIKPQDMPLGVCTSSGTVGHSLSFGKADAACIISKSASLADAVATATGNIVKTKDDVEKAIDYAKSVKGIDGALVIIGDKIGAWGKIELV